MANSDKNIKITPNISQTAQPNVVFTGQGAVPITLKVLDDSFGTLSFEGSAGQLFSVNNNLSTGVIFSVNDISGIPQIDVNADGTIRLAPFAFNVQVAGLTLGKGASGISTNTAFGVSALVANTTGSTNTAVGSTALLVCTTSGGNTAIGNDTLKTLTTGVGSNTAVGDSALRALTTGGYNTAVGLYAALNMTTASGTVSIGMFAGRWLNNRSTTLTAPTNSIYIGHEAFGFSATETNAIVIGGYQAAGRGSNTTVIGTSSTVSTDVFGTLTTTLTAAAQKGLIVKGFTSQTANLQEWQDSAGTALAYVSYTGDSWFNGIRVGTGPGTTTYNTTIGSGAFNSNTSGTHTTAIGYNALNANTSGGVNIAVGAFALQSNTTGAYNTAIGYSALGSVTTQSNNTAIGRAAISGSTGSGNTAVGSTIALALTTGSSNVLVGNSTAQALTTGSLNIAIGANCLTYTTTADGNISIGHESARLQADGTTALTASNNNIYIGTYVKGLNNSDTNSIVIGCYAVGKGANTTVIGTTSTTTSYLYGETHYIGGVAGTAISILPQTRSTTGAGANVTIAAGAGVTTGAGGSIILQPGAQATSGGDGVVVVRQPGGTAGTDEIQISHDGTNGYIASKDGDLIARSNTGYVKVQNSAGTASARLNITDTTGGGLLLIDGCYQIQLAPSTSIRSNVSHIFGSGSENFFNSAGIGLANGAYVNFYTGPSYVSSADSGLVRGSVGQVKVTDASTGGGSFAFTSSSPSGYAANQDNLVLTGSAFQRLSGTAARDITGVAPPSGGSHVDGRMMRIYNVGSFNLTLKHNSTSSTAANRFFCIQSVDIIVSANDFAELIYDSTNNGSGAAGWRVA